MSTGPPDPHILGPGLTPTPFTADEIQRGCPVGRTIRLLVEAEGEKPFLRTNRFVACDEVGATIESARLTIDGQPMGPAEASRSTWLELQSHASFQAARTDIMPEAINIPLGVLDCLRYTVSDGSTIKSFWFAREAPGMPVKYIRHEAGRVVSSVTMIANTKP